MQIIEFLIGLFGSPTYSRAADPSVETSTFEPIPPPNGLMATIGSDISVPFSSSGWQRKRGRHPPRFPWPGCSAKSRIFCRSRAAGRPSACGRTWPPGKLLSHKKKFRPSTACWIRWSFRCSAATAQRKPEGYCVHGRPWKAELLPPPGGKARSRRPCRS